jgi:hemerythrin superfamily protein
MPIRLFPHDSVGYRWTRCPEDRLRDLWLEKRERTHLMTTATTHKKSSVRKAASSSKDALAILKADHRAVEKLFTSFENAGDRAYKTKRRLVDQMIEALSIHAFIEEQVLYPAARSDVPSANDDVLEALEEHHIVKWELQELIDLDPEDERFAAKVTVLSENVRHHVKEEEKELFPLLRSNLPKARLQELGTKLEGARAVAPHHPHPRLPAGPPEHLLPDAVSSVIDRAKVAVKSVRSAS